MGQLFHPSANTIAKASIFGAAFFVVGAFWIGGMVVRSPWITEADVIRQQPVQFSHKHHVSDDGIDCRYCHVSVETSRFAGIPSTETCMNCHTRIWADSPMLEPVRESWRAGTPLRWTRVHNLPDFAYFDHSAHLNKGVGCVSCHGRVDRMPLMRRQGSLQMEWCLDCHRNPGPALRPKDKLFDMSWTPEGDPKLLAQKLMKEYAVQSKTNCSVCHR